jgi:hypothetical protein
VDRRAREAPVTAAIIALGVTASLAVSLAGYALHRALSAAGRETTARVHEAELGADLRIALANLRTTIDRADAEQRRADALDDLLSEMPAGDAAGARERVLARYRARAPGAAGDPAGPVPAPPDAPAVAGVDRDGLLRPGD